MKKNRLDKKDLLYMSILTGAFILFVVVVTRGKFMYGSTLDWESQHSVIPDYFRTLFYKTHDILPDLALNIGGGQNIYNLAYYGLLNPIIMLSYLFPFVSMPDFIAISSIITAITSGILFYSWLRRNHGANHKEALLASFSFLFATSLSFHSHRHVMFMSYMPFLLMGLFGVDAKLDEHKGTLLSLSVFLMIMTSFYYSVGGIVALVIYGIYKWIKNAEEISIKNFFKVGLNFLIPIFLGIACSAILLLPTAHVILSSRGETFNAITWQDLFLPGVNVEYFLYNSYGLGLTSIAIVAIIVLLCSHREKLFLGIVLSAMICFPFISYLLNATMYIDAKAFIPMLPLAGYAIYLFINDACTRKVNWRKVFAILVIVCTLASMKGGLNLLFLADITILATFILLFIYKDKVQIFATILIVLPIAVSLITSSNDKLVNLERNQELYKKYPRVISSITEADDGLYRISNANTILRDVNNLYGNIDYYSSTIYSSTYNLDYNKFYYDTMNNPIQNRNRVITSPTANILFLLFSGNKYLISNKANYFGYEPYKTVNNYKIYKNENAFPLIYAREDTLKRSNFDSLPFPEQSIALLKRVVVEDDESTKEYSPSAKKFSFNKASLDTHGLEIKEENGVYSFTANEKTKMTYHLPKEQQNKIIFVKFKMLESASCSEGDTGIIIDGVENKLTCKSWKYHNQNYDFTYTLPNKDRLEYEIKFAPGPYKIEDIEVYSLDYEDIAPAKRDLDELIVDKDDTQGDVITGRINARRDGYLVTSIPYDEGYKIWIDGHLTDTIKLNTTFLGAKITKGEHEVKIEYTAPLKESASIVSAIGLCLCVLQAILDSKNKKKISIQ